MSKVLKKSIKATSTMTSFCIVVVETNNNIFVSLLDKEKKLIKQLSGGELGMKGPKRRTPLTGELIGKRFSTFLRDNKIKNVGLFVKGKFTGIVRGVFRGLANRGGVKFLFLEEHKGVAHNGVRLKKQRRL